MSREILFRIKDGNNKWVYGFPLVYDDGSFAFIDRNPLNELKPTEMCEIHSAYNDTLGQYTGLTDKNGTKIFEGDIIEMHYFFENHDPNTLGVFEDEDYIIGYLIYDELGLVIIDKNNTKYRVSEYVQEPCEELEVIGNIFDNPKLLKED